MDALIGSTKFFNDLEAARLGGFLLRQSRRKLAAFGFRIERCAAIARNAAMGGRPHGAG